MFVPLGRQRRDGDYACTDGFGESLCSASGVFFLDENDFYSRCLCLIDELLQVFGRGLLAIFLYDELPQPEITSEVAQCRVVDDEGALMQAVEQPMDGDFGVSRCGAAGCLGDE